MDCELQTEDVLSKKTPVIIEGPDDAILEKCKQAIVRLEARKGEDIDKWAERIARDVVPEEAPEISSEEVLARILCYVMTGCDAKSWGNESRKGRYNWLRHARNFRKRLNLLKGGIDGSSPANFDQSDKKELREASAADVLGKT